MKVTSIAPISDLSRPFTDKDLAQGPCFVRCVEADLNTPALLCEAVYRVRGYMVVPDRNSPRHCYQLEGFVNGFNTTKFFNSSMFKRFDPTMMGNLVHINGSKSIGLVTDIEKTNLGVIVHTHAFSSDRNAWLYGGKYLNPDLAPALGLRIGVLAYKALENFSGENVDLLVIDDPEFQLPKEAIVTEDSLMTAGDRARANRIAEVQVGFYESAARAAAFAEEYTRETGKVIPGSQAVAMFSKSKRVR